MVDGVAEAVLEDGRVRVVTSAGDPIFCRVPMHISLPWLRAALVRGVVAVEATVGEAGPPEHGSHPGPQFAG